MPAPQGIIVCRPWDTQRSAFRMCSGGRAMILRNNTCARASAHMCACVCMCVVSSILLAYSCRVYGQACSQTNEHTKTQAAASAAEEIDMSTNTLDKVYSHASTLDSISTARQNTHASVCVCVEPMLMLICSGKRVDLTADPLSIAQFESKPHRKATFSLARTSARTLHVCLHRSQHSAQHMHACHPQQHAHAARAHLRAHRNRPVTFSSHSTAFACGRLPTSSSVLACRLPPVCRASHQRRIPSAIIVNTRALALKIHTETHTERRNSEHTHADIRTHKRDSD